MKELKIELNKSGRLKNKYDSYENWASSGLVLEAGEIAIAYTTVDVAVDGGTAKHPALLMKVGDGVKTFANLPWLSAKAADVLSVCKNEDDFILPIGMNHLTVYDNTEYLPQKLNELLCKAVTGGQIPKRKLYTNSERVLVDLKSAIIMNGISTVIRREDLMSRVIFITTKSNEGFKTSEFSSNNVLYK